MTKASTKNLEIVLIHGTWAGKGRWTQHDSPFRSKLRDELKSPVYQIGYDVHFTPFPWDGKLRVKARQEVVEALQKEIKDMISRYTPDREYLLIGHHHGGNIAVDALRNLLSNDPQIPIKGVVCLNTPFFKLEPRGASSYLRVWFVIALAEAFAFWEMGMNQDQTNGFLSLPPKVLFIALVSVTLLLGLLCIVSGILIRKEGQAEPQCWGPRPDVLCLSCPDDEAITFLGLGEGLSNLPQLLLHPASLIIAALLGLFLLYTNWIPDNLRSPHRRLDIIVELFTLWTGISLVGGALGASAVTFMFGLQRGASSKHYFRAL